MPQNPRTAAVRMQNQRLRAEGHGGLATLGDVLHGVLKENGLDRRGSARTLRLFDAFDTAVAHVSRTHAAHCRPTGFRHGNLYVDCDSAPVLAELSTFHKLALLSWLGEICPECHVARIIWRNRSRE